ncbi:MAG: 3-oxoacyl-[acyl-carrier-protein] reductase [Nitrospinota bacterium]
MPDQKVALITGAAQGIGLAVATSLAEGGAHSLLADVNIEGAQREAERLREKGFKARALYLDVGDAAGVERALEEVLSQEGRIDILVNNAGIVRDGLLIRLRPSDWEDVLRVNLTGTYHCTRLVARSMLKQRSGRIINVASVVGLMGNAGQANYAASKAAIVGFTKAVARELAGRGVTVNAVAPGFIDTEMTRSMPAEARESFLAQIPVGRLGTPEDVASVVCFLASSEASYITGQVIQVNGGLYM